MLFLQAVICIRKKNISQNRLITLVNGLFF